MKLLHLIFSAVLVVMGGSNSDDIIPMWNIRKFLSEVVYTGLGVDRLQDYFEAGYQWQSEEINEQQRLQKMIQKVSKDLNQSIEIVVKLKRTIEQTYGTWKPQQANASSLCCQYTNHPNGCALVNRRNRDKPQLASSPPSSVLREMKHNNELHPGAISQYFVFRDGSLYMYPAISEETLTCENYDPLVRYFYSQCKSPEPRDVVVLVHGGPHIRPLLRDIAKGTIDGLSLMDRVGLCLPGTDGCRVGPFGAENTVPGPSWPGSDIPLGRQPYLGQMLFSNNKNKNQLRKCLDSWPDTLHTFPSHLAAVNAGLDFLNSNSKHPLGLSTGVHHKVLVYITTEEAWKEDPTVQEKLGEAVLNGTSVVVDLIQEGQTTVVEDGETTIMQDEKATVVQDGETAVVQDGEITVVEEEILSEQNNVSLKVVYFSTKSSFVDSQTSIPSFGQNNNNQPVITIPYWDAFGMGYIITVCMPLVFGGEFVGVACNDVNAVNFLADTTIHDIENAYVFLINSRGITLMHPLLPSPHSITEDPATVTIDKLEQHRASRSLLKKIISQETGTEDVKKGVLVEALGWPPGSSQPNAVRGKSASLRYLWGPITQTNLTLILVLPLTNGKVVSTSYKCFNRTACETRNFHYHKSKPGDTSRSFCKYLGTQVVYDQGLVKFAPDSFNNMLQYILGEGNESISKIYHIFNGTRPFNELLRTDLRASVKLAETAVSVWKSAKNVRQYIVAQYMGTADGVFISFPGSELKPTYDHRSRPWYQLTISSLNEDHLSMTTPRCNRYGSTMVYTLARSLHSYHGTPLAVVAGDFTLPYIMELFLNQVPDCKLYMCLLVDQMGYVVLTTNWSSESSILNCDNKSDITAAHIIRLVPDIARDMINRRLLRRLGCHDYERDITFYYWWLNMRGHRTLHKGDTYEVHKIISSNLYFVIEKQGLGQGTCHCFPYQEEDLMECHDTCKMECECPCKAGSNTMPCHNAEADIHSSRWPLPACKPSDPSHPHASNSTLEELQELHHCYKCDGQKERECKKRVSCVWKDNHCRNFGA